MRQRWTTSTKPSHPILKTRHATNVKRPRGIVDFCFLLSNLKSLLTHFHDLIIFFFETLLEYILQYFYGVESKIFFGTTLITLITLNIILQIIELILVVSHLLRVIENFVVSTSLKFFKKFKDTKLVLQVSCSLLVIDKTNIVKVIDSNLTNI